RELSVKARGAVRCREGLRARARAPGERVSVSSHIPSRRRSLRQRCLRTRSGPGGPVASHGAEGRQATKVGLLRAGERLERSRGFGRGRLCLRELSVKARGADGCREGLRALSGVRRADWAFTRMFRRGGAPCASVAFGRAPVAALRAPRRGLRSGRSPGAWSRVLRD